MTIQDRTWFKKFFLSFFLIISILQIFDFATTWYITTTVDISVENNPFIRTLLSFDKGIYLMVILKTVVMSLYFIFGWWWVNHPINFYKPKQQIVFKLLQIIIWFMYSYVVALNFIGIIMVRFYG